MFVNFRSPAEGCPIARRGMLLLIEIYIIIVIFRIACTISADLTTEFLEDVYIAKSSMDLDEPLIFCFRISGLCFRILDWVGLWSWCGLGVLLLHAVADCDNFWQSVMPCSVDRHALQCNECSFSID